MDGEAVKEIAALADAQKTIEVDGQTFARQTFTPVYADPRPEALKGKTLTGLVEYINSNREAVDFSQAMLQVASPGEVRLFTRYEGKSAARTMFFRAELDAGLPVFPFDAFMPVEDFIIKAKALFQPNDDMVAAIALVSKITEQNQITAKDDGISQEVQVKKGVSGAVTEGATTRGCYTLRPYRTFRELMQPESRFILRIRAVEGKLPHVALFDAEGGVWRNFAVKAIKDYLDAELFEVGIPVLA